MVWHHVTQRAGVFEVATAALHSNGLRDGDLHVLNIAAVPHRLEDSISKPKRQHILDSFFAQVVINSVDLVFFQYFLDLRVQRSRTQ